MKRSRSRSSAVFTVFGAALIASLAFGGLAFASSSYYNATLPAFQGNVTIASGKKSSATTKAATTKPTSIKAGSAWQWLDDSNGRASDSRLTYPHSSTKLVYYMKSKRGGILLRACTDGWKDPGLIKGNVNFG